jgi:hypothetical protein
MALPTRELEDVVDRGVWVAQLRIVVSTNHGC